MTDEEQLIEFLKQRLSIETEISSTETMGDSCAITSVRTRVRLILTNANGDRQIISEDSDYTG